MSFYGINASRKAERFAEAVFKRARRMLRLLNIGDYSRRSLR